MTNKVTSTSSITLNGKTFDLQFRQDYEVLLSLRNPPISRFDHWGDSSDGYARTYTGVKTITLTRWVIREIETFLKAHKPPFIYYTVGFDFSRYSLYYRIGGMFEKLGYCLSHTPNSGEFYLYRSIAG